ncbi:alpha/beta hydrolase [Nocardia uniformis]|uniref:Alpha/beta hydrolase n=2 Tax=Nocardia uniformis TaxID=53432 RepID=A0A849C8W5_9NOCA|nr:alpha/beta hydrolase [Nocardia uniformis]
MLITGCATDDDDTADTATASQESITDTVSGDGKGRYAAVNGLQLYYEIHGTGQPLVLLHGGLGNAETSFSALLPELTKNRKVITVDLQAHGHTADIDRPLSFEQMADDVAGLIDHLELEKVDVLGYSLGGGVALQLGSRNPDVVNKLVINSAAYRFDGWTAEGRTGMASIDPTAMIGTPMHEAYTRTAPRPGDWPVFAAKTKQLLTRDFDWTTEVAAITAPTLVVIAESDIVERPHAVDLINLLGSGTADATSDTAAATLEIVPGTTHYDILYRADLLLPIIEPFLDAPGE